MTMSEFFVYRPILAIVISIVMLIAGLVALAFLPVSLFPNITPPEVVVSATNPGSDAVTVEQSVAAPIEEQLNGVDLVLGRPLRLGIGYGLHRADLLPYIPAGKICHQYPS